jgi:hypothetical protein
VKCACHAVLGTNEDGMGTMFADAGDSGSALVRLVREADAPVEEEASPEVPRIKLAEYATIVHEYLSRKFDSWMRNSYGEHEIYHVGSAGKDRPIL